MEITKTIQAGKTGSKNLLNQYGDRLICVRYRIDRLTKKRYTTVELIVNEKNIIDFDVWVNIRFNDKKLRIQLIKEGAKWNSEKRMWKMSYETAITLKLRDRIIEDVAH